MEKSDSPSVAEDAEQLELSQAAAENVNCYNRVEAMGANLKGFQKCACLQGHMQHCLQ